MTKPILEHATEPVYGTLPAPICRGLVHSMADDEGKTHPISSVYEIDGEFVVTPLDAQ